MGYNTIVCIGDSLTNGIYNVIERPTRTLVMRLAEKFQGITVVNLGVNADTTTLVEARKESADAYNPFMVNVWIGGNDILFSVSTATIKSNLQTIYSYYKGKGYKVQACTITNYDTWDSTQVAARTEMNDWINNTATDVDSILDLYTIIRDPDHVDKRLPAYCALTDTSRAHLNDAAYDAIVNEFTL